MKNKYQIVISIVFLLFTTIITHKVWLLGFSTVIGSDWGFYFTQTMQEWFPIHNLWNSQLNFGYYDFVSVPYLPIFFLRGLLSTVHVDFVVIDRLLYLYPIALLTPLSMFYVCYKFTKNSIASLIGALYYSLNTYILTIEIGAYTLALVYALFPMLFIVFDNFLKKPSYKKLLYFVLLLLISFTNEARITFIALIMLSFYFVFSIVFFKEYFPFKKIIHIVKFFILGIAIFTSLLSFFIVPLGAFHDIGIEDIAGRGFFAPEFFPLQNAMTLFHPFWDGTITTEFVPQPIPFYFWLFPIFAFSALFFVKREKKIYFFALLALIGVFLGKGISSPFGNVFIWLYAYVPGFNFFREPTKFYFIIAFAYSFLFAYCIKYFFLLNKKSFLVNKLLLVLKVFFVVTLAGLIIFISNPTIRETIADSFRNIRVPNEYLVLRDFLLQKNDFFRVLYLPNRQRFEFLSRKHPSLSYIEIPEKMRTIDPKILTLYSVKYVILPYDSTNDIYRHFGPRALWEKMIQQTKELKKVEISGLKNVVVYENMLGYLSHIFIANNAVYIDGDASTMQNIASKLPEKRSAIYLTRSPSNKNKNVTDDFYNQVQSYFFSADCIRCFEEKPWENFDFPYARILPNSLFYSFISWKEQKDLSSIPASSTDYSKQRAYYSLKRIIEVQEMNDLKVHIEYIKQSLKVQKELIDELYKYVYTLDNTNLNNNDILLKLDDYVIIEKKILYDVILADNTNYATKVLLQDAYGQLDRLSSLVQTKIWKSSGNKKRYIVNILKDSDAIIMIKNNLTSSSFTLSIDGKSLSQAKATNDYLVFDKLFLSKGKHRITLELNNDKNLVASNSALFIAEPSQGVKKFTIPISDMNEVENMRVSFNYKIEQGGKSPRYFLSQNADRYNDGKREVEFDQYLRVGEGQWNKNVGEVIPKSGVTTANLNFWIEANGDQETDMQIQNLKVESISAPSILIKVDNNVPVFSSPSIKIRDITPTHYKVDISGAVNPFILVLNEQFHSGWRASIDKESIPGNQHIEVNGYANAWVIDKKGNYIVDITFYPEKYYNIGIGLTIATLVIVVIPIFIRRKNKDEKKI